MAEPTRSNLPRVMIMQPSRAPYRIALFKRLAEHFDISVMYVAGAHDVKRSWQARDEDTVFQSINPPFFAREIFGKRLSFSLKGAVHASKNHDIIVTCTNVLELPTYLLASLIARFRGKKVLCMVSVSKDYEFIRGKGVIGELMNRVVRISAGLLIKLSNYTINYSESCAAVAKSWGRDGKTSSQYYPLAEEYDGVMRDLGRESSRVGVKPSIPLEACLVGYISPRKGLDNLFSAIERLQLTERVRITVAGPLTLDDPYIEGLVQRSPKNVTFCGSVDAAQKARLFGASDIMFFPTLHDSWGYVANEAMYWGVPVIASTGSQAALDLIETGVNGWVYSDDGELLSAIVEALDPAVYKRVSNAARQSVINFNENCLRAWVCALQHTASAANTKGIR